MVKDIRKGLVVSVNIHTFLPALFKRKRVAKIFDANASKQIAHLCLYNEVVGGLEPEIEIFHIAISYKALLDSIEDSFGIADHEPHPICLEAVSDWTEMNGKGEVGAFSISTSKIYKEAQRVAKNRKIYSCYPRADGKGQLTKISVEVLKFN